MTTDLAGSLPIARPDGLVSLAAKGDAEPFGRSGLVACIPACDEAERIEACVRAADEELRPGDGIVIFANNCRDDTAARAYAALARARRPWLLLDGVWAPGEGTAPKARRLAMDVAQALAPSAHLLSLDGDTIVRPGLREAYGRAFAAGFDLVCGAIGFHPEETERLPAADPEQQRVVRDYRRLSRHLAALIDPDPDNPWPHHGNVGGANFAIRSEAYRRVGGLPTPPFAEDRALRRLCQTHGLRIRYSDEALVWTSCRLDGRARGGLADELLRERTEEDPLVDELLEPPQTLLLRLETRRAFLSAGEPRDRLRLLLDLGLDPRAAGELAEAGGPGAWGTAEDFSPRLERRRLHLSDLRRHLPELRRRHHAIAGDPAGTPAPPTSPGS